MKSLSSATIWINIILQVTTTATTTKCSHKQLNTRISLATNPCKTWISTTVAMVICLNSLLEWCYAEEWAKTKKTTCIKTVKLTLKDPSRTMTTTIAIKRYKPTQGTITTQDSTTLWTSSSTINEIYQPDCLTCISQSTTTLTITKIKAYFSSSHLTDLRTPNLLSSSKLTFWVKTKPSDSLSLRSMSLPSLSTNLRNASLSSNNWIAVRKLKTPWNRNSLRNKKSCKCVYADRTQCTRNNYLSWGTRWKLKIESRLSHLGSRQSNLSNSLSWITKGSKRWK